MRRRHGRGVYPIKPQDTIELQAIFLAEKRLRLARAQREAFEHQAFCREAVLAAKIDQVKQKRLFHEALQGEYDQYSNSIKWRDVAQAHLELGGRGER